MRRRHHGRFEVRRTAAAVAIAGLGLAIATSVSWADEQPAGGSDHFAMVRSAAREHGVTGLSPAGLGEQQPRPTMRSLRAHLADRPVSGLSPASLAEVRP